MYMVVLTTKTQIYIKENAFNKKKIYIARERRSCRNAKVLQNPKPVALSRGDLKVSFFKT